MLHLAMLVPHADPLPLEKMYGQKTGAGGVDHRGLVVYSIYRGTNSEESMHGHMARLFKGGHYGPQLAQV